jgi:hypothetical protein
MLILKKKDILLGIKKKRDIKVRIKKSTLYTDYFGSSRLFRRHNYKLSI